jgi:hypothetical protein
MKSFLRGYSLVVPIGLLLPICSSLVLFFPAQGNQDQDQPTATLSLNSQYSAEVSTWDTTSTCEDKITLTFGGTVRYKLLPLGYGTPHVDPAAFGVSPGKGIKAERSGAFTSSYQGGGQCVFKKRPPPMSTPAPVSWTYGTKSTQVDPAGFPEVGVNLRRGEYNVEGGALGAGGLTVSGGLNGQSLGTAQLCLALLQEQSLLKVAESSTGKFEPFSKDFRVSKSVTNTIDWPPPPPAGSPPPETAPGTGSKGSGTMSFSYTLTFGNPEEVEAIMIPQPDGNPSYEEWMPVGGPDEDTPGNTITVKVVLQKKGQPGSTPAEKAQFKFELENVSKEPGVCLNWPPASPVKKEPDFDLKIVKQQDPQNPQNTQNMLLESVGKDGQSAMSKDKLTEVVLTITSYDWGAWGTLKVTAILDDPQHTPVVAHLKDKPNIEALSIPKDDNGNHIADAWEMDHVLTGSTQAESDDDDQPQGDNHTGDGLSLYEEYRGFRIKGGHTRTSPALKDLFVWDFDNLGLGYFGASELDVHLLASGEFTQVQGSDPNPLVVNFNHGFAHLCDVHVLLLMDGEAQGRLGVAIGGPGTPKKIRAVYVDRAKCMKCRWKELDVANTVAHELGHCCNVEHHGDGNYDVDEVWRRASNGNWYSLGKGKQGMGGPVAAPGRTNSGDQYCIMRYIYASYYQYAQGQYRWHDPNNPNAWIYGEYYPPAVEPGTIFCTSKAGTGQNAADYKPAPKAGDATLGNCARQICVNDLKH